MAMCVLLEMDSFFVGAGGVLGCVFWEKGEGEGRIGEERWAGGVGLHVWVFLRVHKCGDGDAEVGGWTPEVCVAVFSRSVFIQLRRLLGECWGGWD